MPNSPDKDSEISAMLNQAEPPKSPAHVDAAILRYARAQAEATRAARQGPAWAELAWFKRHWVPAVTTLSVAAIAISISLQQFSEPELATTSDTGLEPARNEVLSLAPALTEEEPRAMSQQALTAPARDALAAADDAVEADFAAGAAPPQPTSVAELLAQDLANPAEVAPDAEALRTTGATTALATAAARRSATAQAPAAPAVRPDLAALLVEDVSLQDTVIIALRRALGMREQTNVVRQGRFPDEIRPYLETYRGLSNATTLATVQSRYNAARAELIDARLPETVAALVMVLETLE